MTEADRDVLALIRYIIIQAARDGELDLAGRSDTDLRDSIQLFMRKLNGSGWQAVMQSEHQPTLHRAAERFMQEDEHELAIVMYATAIEHWLNGMIEVGLRRRGEALSPETERGHLENKLTARWNELFFAPFPDDLRERILTLASARNNFVHYKWPMHSETEHDADRADRRALAQTAPRLVAELEDLENWIVFDGARAQLDRVLDEMALSDVGPIDP